MELKPFVFRHEGNLVGVRRMEMPEGRTEDTSLLDAVNRFALRPLENDEFFIFRLTCVTTRLIVTLADFRMRNWKRLMRWFRGDR